MVTWHSCVIIVCEGLKEHSLGQKKSKGTFSERNSPQRNILFISMQYAIPNGTLRDQSTIDEIHLFGETFYLITVEGDRERERVEYRGPP